MKKTKSLYGTVVLTIALMMAGGFANAQCVPTIGNYSSCPTKFLSISSDKCASTWSIWDDYTITITVNQSGASYQVYPGGNCSIISSSTSGTTLTYILRRSGPYPGQAGMAVHMTGSCGMQNFAAIDIPQ